MLSRQPLTLGLAALLLVVGLAPGASALSSVAAPATPPAFNIHIVEATRRFGLPEGWIRAVMHAESAGNPQATSRAGAMGLMQIMPATWAELRLRHGLGADPYDPRDNILAGAAYLRELYDRYGAPGFLAAYNAGPGRYDDHLTTGRPLPLETRTYLANLVPRLSQAMMDGAKAPATSPDWAGSALFPARSSGTADDIQNQGAGPTRARSNVPSSPSPGPALPAQSLFVRLSSGAPSP